MKSIILCEGKDDAILLGYFMQIYGWKRYDNDKSKRLAATVGINHPISAFGCGSPENNQVGDAFYKELRELLIYGVGGNWEVALDFFKKLMDLIKKQDKPKDRFCTIAIFLDHDENNAEKWQDIIKQYVVTVGKSQEPTPKPGDWFTRELETQAIPSERIKIKILFIIIPEDKPGNLETFLLDGIRELDSDRNILVDKSDAFIKDIVEQTDLFKELKKSRQIKAQLGCALSVLCNDLVFENIHKLLQQIHWEELEKISEVYKKLRDI